MPASQKPSPAPAMFVQVTFGAARRGRVVAVGATVVAGPSPEVGVKEADGSAERPVRTSPAATDTAAESLHLREDGTPLTSIVRVAIEDRDASL